MDTKKRLLITYLPLIIGFITAETIVYLGRDNNMANYIGLIIALITVAGSILANFFQYKKDSNKIGEVKSDTSEIKPKVDTIKECTKETNDIVAKKMVYQLESILEEQKGSIKTNLATLTEDLRYKQRLEKKYSAVTRDMLNAGINTIYEENAALQEKNMELKSEVDKLKISIHFMEQKNTELKNSIHILQNTISELKSYEKEDDFEM